MKRALVCLAYLVLVLIVVCLADKSVAPSLTQAPLHRGHHLPSPTPSQSPKPTSNSTLNAPEQMMMILLGYITSEGGGSVTQPCVLAKQGPGIFSPPAIARASFALARAMYNAWTRFHPWAEATVDTSDVQRVHVRGKTPAMTTILNEAIVTSAYLVINHLLPDRTNVSSLAIQLQTIYGILDIKNPTRSVGSTIAHTLTRRLIKQLKVDGSNQEGCYVDKSLYVPINNPAYLDCLENVTIANAGCRGKFSWTQIGNPPMIANPAPFLFPQAGVMKSFAVNANNIIPPPLPSQQELEKMFLDLVEVQGSLSLNDSHRKLIAEYWIDGGGSPSPPGHWILMAIKEVARIKSYTTSQSVRLLFILTAGVYDAGIASWNAKRYYNSARPGVLIPCALYSNLTTILQNQYTGPYCNPTDIPAFKWIPYQPLKLNSPPFPEYPSGHSTFSSAAANILGNFTGSRRWPAGPKSVTFAPGTSLFSFQCFQNGTSMYGSKCTYGSCRTNSNLNSENNYLPRGSVTIGPWETYHSAAASAGISRIYGGIHIMVSNTEGLSLGGRVAKAVFDKACGMMPCFEDD